MVALRRWICILFSFIPASHLCALVLPPDSPFHIMYQYNCALGNVKEADTCRENFQLHSALFLYLEARTLLERSKVEDKALAFHIEVAVLFCDEFLEPIPGRFQARVADLFEKFAKNPPPVKIEFDSGGSIHECESFPEAQ